MTAPTMITSSESAESARVQSCLGFHYLLQSGQSAGVPPRERRLDENPIQDEIGDWQFLEGDALQFLAFFQRR